MNSLVSYVPPAVNISNISNSFPAVVTTATPHGYPLASLLNIRIVIPYPNVMPQLNEQDVIALVASPTTLFLAYSFNGFLNGILQLDLVDSTNFDPWSAGPLVTCTVPQPQPLPPAPPIPPAPPVTFTVSGQVAQIVPIGEPSFTLINVSDVIGPRNLP